MINKDPLLRPSANDALNHSWFTQVEITSVNKDECLIESLRKLKNFQAYNTMQKAVLSYIASQQMEDKLEDSLRAAFASLDIDKDGHLTEKELLEGFLKIHNNTAKAKREASRVLQRADVNMNGMIDYNEFIMTNMKFKKMLSEEKLKRAFDFYDIVF